MPQNSNDTTEDGDKLNFYDLAGGERHLIAVVLTILFLMGIVGNTLILYVIKGFKPPVNQYSVRLLINYNSNCCVFRAWLYSL